MTARSASRAPSPSRSKRRWRSAPAITAPRAVVFSRSTGCCARTAAPHPRCRHRHGRARDRRREGAYAAAWSPATSTRSRFKSRAAMRGSTGSPPLIEALTARGVSAPAIARAGALRPGVRQHSAAAAQAAGERRWRACWRLTARVILSGLLPEHANAARRRLPRARAAAGAPQIARRLGDADLAPVRGQRDYFSTAHSSHSPKAVAARCRHP